MQNWDALKKCAHRVKYLYCTVGVVIILLFSSIFLGVAVYSANEMPNLSISCKIYFDTPILSNIELNNTIYTDVNMPKCISDSHVGDPLLPVYSARILIPKEEHVKSVSVFCSNPVWVSYDFVNKPVVPEQKAIPVGSNEVCSFELNETAYSLNAPAVKEYFTQGDLGFCRGYEILTIYLYPVVYIPKSGSLGYYPEMTVNVYLEDEKVKLSEQNNQFLRNNDLDKAFVKDIVENPEDIITYMPSYAPLGGGQEPLNYPGGLCDPADSYDFVIITSNSLKDTTGYIYNWSDLIDHRAIYDELFGKIVTVEEIDACQVYWNETSLFNDSQAHMREFCKDAYSDWGTQYIILGGDWDTTTSHQIVPYRLFTDRYESETYNTMACDKYFSHLDGDWYDAADDIWGGGRASGVNDLYGELYVGRICAYNAEMVSNAINKIINYDLNQSLSDSWYSSASFFGGNLGWTATSKDYMEEIRLGTDTYRTFTGFEEWNSANPADLINTSERLYHADLGANYKDYFVNSIENDNASIINHIDHSDWTTPFGLSSWQYIVNTKPFFGFSQGCLAGRFHSGYAGSEQLMCRYPDRNAFALVLNTGYGYGSSGNTNGASQYIEAFFWDYFFNNQSNNQSNWQLGKAFLYASDKMGAIADLTSTAWCYAWYSAHFFGDPAQILKLRGPSNLAPVISGVNPSTGSTNVSINSLTLNATIVDPDGDTFNWTIQSSPDVGNSSGNNESNGSKNCSISGLLYSTNYIWYVNATDGIVSVARSFTFTTESEPVNNPPIFSLPSINNSTTNVSVSISSLNISIEDPEGNSFNWTIETDFDIGSNFGNNESNGTKYCNVSGLSYNTTYNWYVNATDGVSWKKEWYSFTTKSVETNNPVEFSGENPENNSEDVSVSDFILEITVEDPDGDTINWTIQTYPDIGANSGDNDTNGDKLCSVSSLSYDTTYTWYINASDGNLSTCETYYFTTRSVPHHDSPHHSNPAPPNEAPTAEIQSTEIGYVNESIVFDGSGSTDSDGSIVSYFWDFGDESNGAGQNISHVYSSAGNFTVTLTVTDQDGATDLDSASLTIQEIIKNETEPLPPTDDVIINETTNDFDNDGLPNILEEEFGSDIYNSSDVESISVAGEICYLIDTDSDGDVDLFYSPASGISSTLGHDAKGNYLIDADGDGKWDYTYDSVRSYLSPFVPISSEEGKQQFSYWIIVLITFILVVTAIVVSREKITIYLIKRRVSILNHDSRTSVFHKTHFSSKKSRMHFFSRSDKKNPPFEKF